MTKEYTKHYSVLHREILQAFSTLTYDKNLVLADLTFGGGGHTLMLAKEIENAIIYCVDQDPDALKNGENLITNNQLQDRVILNSMNYEEFPLWVSRQDQQLRFNGILMDLGVSSHHFDDFTRGFSFREDAFLDMRMNFNDESIPTAAEVLNSLSEKELADMIFVYGEERFSRKIAKNIIEFRRNDKLERTKQLEDIVFHSYPKHLRHKKTHPATKTFQALRIFVNRELEVLENSLEKLFELLDTGGILAVISFHSLEDRIVKHKFKEIFQTHTNLAKILTKKPIIPTEEEIAENSRSRSAKLRLLQKIDPNTQGGVYGKKSKKKAKYNS